MTLETYLICSLPAKQYSLDLLPEDDARLNLAHEQARRVREVWDVPHVEKIRLSTEASEFRVSACVDEFFIGQGFIPNTKGLGRVYRKENEGIAVTITQSKDLLLINKQQLLF